MSAEEYSVGEIGLSAVAFPEDDVVGFCPGWWPGAARARAPAPQDGERFFLFAGEEALLASVIDNMPEVDLVPVVGQRESGETCVAG